MRLRRRRPPTSRKRNPKKTRPRGRAPRLHRQLRTRRSATAPRLQDHLLRTRPARNPQGRQVRKGRKKGSRTTPRSGVRACQQRLFAVADLASGPAGVARAGGARAAFVKVPPSFVQRPPAPRGGCFFPPSSAVPPKSGTATSPPR